MKFLTRRKFENKNFVHYLRTGEFYFYESYLKWFAKLEFKSETEEDEEDEEQSKKKDNLISIFLPDGDTKCIWSGGSCGDCSGMAGMEFTIIQCQGECTQIALALVM